jgi:hypothetical protein
MCRSLRESSSSRSNADEFEFASTLLVKIWLYPTLQPELMVCSVSFFARHLRWVLRVTPPPIVLGKSLEGAIPHDRN